MLAWNVYFEDFNGRQIVTRNIFQLSFTFFQNCQKNYKKNKDNREEFFEQMRKDLMYSYWSRCEYEVIISDWPPVKPECSQKSCAIKVDIYDQVMLNWEPFCDYVWTHKDDFKVKRTRKKKEISI